MKSNFDKAFSIVEILVVVGIVGVLAATVIVGTNQAKMLARDSRRVSDLKRVSAALEEYYEKYHIYPTSTGDTIQNALGVLVSEGFLDFLPDDPLVDQYSYYYESDDEGQIFKLVSAIEGDTKTAEQDGGTASNYYEIFNERGSEQIQLDNTQLALKIADQNEGGQVIMFIEKLGDGSGTVVSSPNGIDCGSTCSVIFDRNSSVTLTATADDGSIFLGWSGNCSGSEASCVLSLDSDKTAKANFSFIRHLLTINKSGDGIVTSNISGINCGSDCSENYLSGTVVSLSATSTSGNNFLGWSGDCSDTGACDLTMDAAKNVTSSFSSSNLSCSIADTCSNVTVLKMFNTTNSHALLPSSTVSSTADYFLCCSGDPTLSNNCLGNFATVLRLSNIDNAHVQKNTYSYYDYKACLSSSLRQLNCIYGTSCDESTYECLASISSSDNAHIGDCDAYSTKVCCRAR